MRRRLWGEDMVRPLRRHPLDRSALAAVDTSPPRQCCKGQENNETY